MPDRLEARAALGLAPDDKVLLSMGHTYTESLFALLDAYAVARQSVPGVKLLFLGKMHISEDFKNRMRAYEERFAPDIRKVGEKSPAEVPHYLAASDALLLPMDDDPIEKARFPIRFGDYLASGVPVVSNAVGEIKRIMETHDCGYTASVGDAGAFGRAIVTALTDAAGRRRKHENARRLIAEELNWPTVAPPAWKRFMRRRCGSRACHNRRGAAPDLARALPWTRRGAAPDLARALPWTRRGA